MKKHHFNIFVILFALAALNFGCAGRRYLTTRYTEVKQMPEGKAIVYIYRVKRLGTAVHYAVNANDKPVNDLHLYLKGYLVYYASPGKTEFWAEIGGSGRERTKVTLDIEAGQTYYIEGSVKMGVWVGAPHLELVDNQEGRVEIKKCKLISEK